MIIEIEFFAGTTTSHFFLQKLATERNHENFNSYKTNLETDCVNNGNRPSEHGYCSSG